MVQTIGFDSRRDRTQRRIRHGLRDPLQPMGVRADDPIIAERREAKRIGESASGTGVGLSLILVGLAAWGLR